MKKHFTTGLLAALVFSLTLPAFAADDLQGIMKEMGIAFNELKKSVQTRGDMSEAAQQQSQILSGLIHEGVMLTPTFSQDAKEQSRKLALFKKVMSETLAVSYATELHLVEQNLEAAKADIDALAQKRREGHELFR